ncbi:unnamed protein product [Closterium sp. NIES-53]
MACVRVLQQQQGQPQRQLLQHSRQWGPEGPRITDYSSGSASRGRDRTTAPVESHLPGIGPFLAARIETCVSSLGACVVSSPGTYEGLCVGAAATTTLAPAFVAGSGATSQTAQLSFTLDFGASDCFFLDCTDLTPLRTPVTIALADPSVGPVVSRSTTTLPCPATPSGFLTGYYTPSFSRNLVGVSHLHDLGVVTTFPLVGPVASCTVGTTRALLATFHREPGSGLYSLHTGSHHTQLGLPESLASLPRSPKPLCTPCVEGRQRAAPHSSLFPPTMAPFQTLHLGIWGPSSVLGPCQERYFLIVVDDYSCYTTVFPLRQKADVPTIFEPWLLARPPPPPQRPVPVVSGGSGGAVAEGEGIGAAGAGGVGSGGVGVEVTPVEDMAFSTRQPRPASPPGFPTIPQFPPRSSLRPVAAEPEGVPARGIRGPGGVSGGGAGSGGAGAGGTGTVAPTPRTVRFLTHKQRLFRLEREERERFEREQQQQQQQSQSQSGAASAVVVAAGESRGGVTAAPGEGREGVLPAAAGAVTDTAGESRGVTATVGEGSPGVPVAAAGAAAATVGEGRGGATVLAAGAGTVAADTRGGGAAATMLARPSRPSTSTLDSWSPTVPSCSPRLVSFLVLVDLSFSPQSCCVSKASSVPLPCRRSISPYSPLTCSTSSCPPTASRVVPHCVSRPVVRLPWCLSSYQVLKDRQFELGFLAAAVPHLCTTLLAPEGDPDALDIPIPRTHAEAVSGPWASYWIAAEEAEMASYRSTGTYVGTVPPPGANVVSGMWLYKVKRPPGAPPVFKARYVHGYELHSLDFSTAFLQGSLHEQIWLPLDFFLSSAAPSLFVRRGSTPFLVLVYVDDLVFATPDRRALASMKEEQQRRQTCTDLGELQRYLGLQITRDRAACTITLTQSHMVEQILTRFRFPFSKVQPTPLAVDDGLTAPPLDEPFESSGPYPELEGCLMYLMTCTCSCELVL